VSPSQRLAHLSPNRALALLLLYCSGWGKVLAKIAVTIEPGSGRATDSKGAPPRQVLARGTGWSVADVVCCAGPRDRSFEEQHKDVDIAIVVQGSFQYRSSMGRELMTPGSLLLGNAGQYFECGHDHAVGDRCISFTYSPEYFATLAAQANTGTRCGCFARLRIPPVRELSVLISRACATLARATPHSNFLDSNAWEEIAIELATRALELASSARSRQPSLPSAEARVTRAIRSIDAHPDWGHNLISLATEAKLSRYHFLRVFQTLTGLTPHQFVLRTRLRNAATRLIVDAMPVLNIALDSGFGDVSNFNHAFHTEFGMSPREYRAMHTHLAF
jgi:AraC family transcriptional regulator